MGFSIFSIMSNPLYKQMTRNDHNVIESITYGAELDRLEDISVNVRRAKEG